MLAAAEAAGAATLTVFEDDAAPAPDFAARFADVIAALPADWDALMLGGEHLAPPEDLGNGLVRCVRTRRTHAYVVRDRYAPRLRALLAAGRGRPGDVWAGAMGAARVYAPCEWLVGVAAGDTAARGKARRVARGPTTWQPTQRPPRGCGCRKKSAPPA